MRNLTLYINITATDFQDWITFFFCDDGPTETFYNFLLSDGGWIWTPVYVMHNPDTESHWWRFSVGIKEGETPIITADGGAIELCITALKKNPYDPRIKIDIGWDSLFPGTIWELLSKLAQDYPETQATIEGWKSTPEGEAATKAAATSQWWETFVSPHHYALLDMVDNGAVTPEELNRLIETEAGAPVVAAFRKAWLALPQTERNWLLKMLDWGEYRFYRGLYHNSVDEEARQQAKAGMVQAYERIATWYPAQREQTTTLPNFSLWSQEQGFALDFTKDDKKQNENRGKSDPDQDEKGIGDIRSDTLPKIAMVRKLKAIWGFSKTAACKCVGTHRRTFNKYSTGFEELINTELTRLDECYFDNYLMAITPTRRSSIQNLYEKFWADPKHPPTGD